MRLSRKLLRARNSARLTRYRLDRLQSVSPAVTVTVRGGARSSDSAARPLLAPASAVDTFGIGVPYGSATAGRLACSARTGFRDALRGAAAGAASPDS